MSTSVPNATKPTVRIQVVKMDNLMKFILEAQGLNPELYEKCKHCQGYGSSFHEDSVKCSQCEGEGVVKKGL